MTIDPIIRRFETLDPETERRCLETFLYSLTGVVRMLWFEDQTPERRSRTLARVSEMNRYVLKRVMAIADREKDTWHTVSYTWHCVNEQATPVPALDKWVALLADDILRRAGA